jgi:hypothetical protein
VIDEGACFSILSGNAWQDFGSPQLMPMIRNLSKFEKRVSQPLGILPHFLVTLGGKTVCVDVMVVHDLGI